MDIGAMLAAAFSSFRATIDAIPRVNLGLFIRQRGRKVSGVYLIYGEHGDLLYVGKSKKVVLRLRQHVAVNGDVGSSLLGDIAREMAYPRARSMVHECLKCRARIPCESGDVKLPTDQRRIDLSGAMKSIYSVAVLSESVASTVTSEELEKFVQFILRPRYGCYLSE